MNKDIKHYIAYYPNFFDKKICNKTIKELKKQKFFKHQFYSATKDASFHLSGDEELSVAYVESMEKLPSTHKFIQDKLWYAIKAYIEQHNFSWFGDWSGYSAIRYNKYDKKTRMHSHCDHIHSLFDGERKGIPTLSIIGCLNDNYEGGDLVFFTDTPIKMKAGSLLIFPSNFLYPHEVKLITKGTRYSFVSWVW